MSQKKSKDDLEYALNEINAISNKLDEFFGHSWNGQPPTISAKEKRLGINILQTEPNWLLVCKYINNEIYRRCVALRTKYRFLPKVDKTTDDPIADVISLRQWCDDAKIAIQNKIDGTGKSKKVPWNDDDPDYDTASNAIVLYAENKLTLPNLSKKLKPNGEIRYMRKGRRCKVHIGDFRKYLKLHHPDINVSFDLLDQIEEGIEKRKQIERKRKR